jgi:hypothetical protein
MYSLVLATMTPLESAIENTVCDWALRHGFLALKVKFVEAGYPDRLFISPFGHTIFIEFKRPGEIPEPIQLYRIGQLQSHGIPAFWSDNVVESISYLQAAVGSSRLPEKSDKTTSKSGGRRVVSGPWSGKNQHMSRRVQAAEVKATSPEDAYHRAATALLQSLAGRDREMGELLQPALDHLARQQQGEKPST